MEEKINIIKMSFYLRLVNKNYTREFTKEIFKRCNSVPHTTSITRYALDAEMSLGSTVIQK